MCLRAVFTKPYASYGSSQHALVYNNIFLLIEFVDIDQYWSQLTCTWRTVRMLTAKYVTTYQKGWKMVVVNSTPILWWKLATSVEVLFISKDKTLVTLGGYSSHTLICTLFATFIYFGLYSL